VPGPKLARDYSTLARPSSRKWPVALTRRVQHADGWSLCLRPPWWCGLRPLAGGSGAAWPSARTVEWGRTSQTMRWAMGLTREMDPHQGVEAEAAVAAGIRWMVEAAIGRRWSGWFPTTPWRRGKCERWLELKRGGHG
jgi:hypothetical protein